MPTRSEPSWHQLRARLSNLQSHNFQLILQSAILNLQCTCIYRFIMYLELHTSSAFSFLEAASLPEALIDQAARYGYSAIALLDRDGVYGAPRFHRAALAAHIPPLTDP